MTDIDEVLIEDATILWPNFSGKEGPMNRAGDRNFCVLLAPDTAMDLARAGWNVKSTRSREEGDPERPYLQIAVGYKVRPPQVWMLTSRGRTRLDEDIIGMLDDVEIEAVDLIFQASHWELGGKHGVKAYLKTLFVRIREDYLMQKYVDVPEAKG